jgi:hypothetical protein
MNTDREKVKNEIILPNLKADEQLIGFFQGMSTPSFDWIILLGPLMYLGMAAYYVAVTSNGLHFHKQKSLFKPAQYNFFPYAEIKKLKLSKGILKSTLNVELTNGRKLKLDGNNKYIGWGENFDEQTRQFLISQAV